MKSCSRVLSLIHHHELFPSIEGDTMPVLFALKLPLELFLLIHNSGGTK